MADPARRKARSPSYPGIHLGTALERARTLYENEGRNASPADVILSDWGYNAGSGGGLVTIAALKKFGLLVDDGPRGTRQYRLSENALRIILDERSDSEDRLRLIKEAALRPPIHAELWKKYEGSFPSDATLKHHLQIERNFTPRGVKELIPELKATFKFARLTESDTLSDDDLDKDGDRLNAEIKIKPPGPAGSLTLRAPLAPGRAVVVQMPERMTAKEWERFEANLAAWKLGTIEEDHSEPNG